MTQYQILAFAYGQFIFALALWAGYTSSALQYSQRQIAATAIATAPAAAATAGATAVAGVTVVAGSAHRPLTALSLLPLQPVLECVPSVYVCVCSLCLFIVSMHVSVVTDDDCCCGVLSI